MIFEIRRRHVFLSDFRTFPTFGLKLITNFERVSATAICHQF
jgi:hypothetical protein